MNLLILECVVEHNGSRSDFRWWLWIYWRRSRFGTREFYVNDNAFYRNPKNILRKYLSCSCFSNRSTTQYFLTSCCPSLSLCLWSQCWICYWFVRLVVRLTIRSFFCLSIRSFNYSLFVVDYFVTNFYLFACLYNQLFRLFFSHIIFLM